MRGITEDELLKEIEKGTPEVALPGVEFKESWDQKYGEDISAIANDLNLVRGWLVIGVKDKGGLAGRDLNWVKKVELDVSNQIRANLSPNWAVKGIIGKSLATGSCLLVEIENPGDIVRWRDKAYKLVGTTSSEMHPAELLSLSIKLPGADISKGKYEGKYDPVLVAEFAKKLVELDIEDFKFDLSKTTSEEVLSKLNVSSTITAGILFGEYSFRLVHFDKNGDILDQVQKQGLYRMLSDQFIEDIQSWTRKQGTVIQGSSATAAEETPYPIRALREILGNAVAHSLYSKANGDIVVELHPNRLVVRNNCRKEAKAFVEKWFSRSHFVYNKHLMNTLRIAKITDEQGSGKIRVFRHMGRQERAAC